MIIIVISVVIAILIVFVLMLSSMIGTLNKQIEAMDREQHEQNQDIIKLMKSNMTHQEMLLQHIEILKYLVEQDPKLNSGKMYFTGPIGKA
jgi:predicted PurR-regulated permease PerM